MRVFNEGSAGVTRLRRKAKAGIKQNPSKKWYKYQKELEKRDAKPESAQKGIENKMKRRQLGEGSVRLKNLVKKKVNESITPITVPMLMEALETRGQKDNPFKNMTKGQYKSEKQAMRKEVNPGGRKKSIKDFTKGRPGKGALPDPRGGNQKRADDSVRTPPASRKTLNRAKGNPVRSAWVAKKNEKAVSRFMSRLPEK